MKKILAILFCLVLVFTVAACGDTSSDSEGAEDTANEAALEDGTYEVTFTTDNSMFHINESLDDKAVLTVENGEMTVHVVLQSKNIVNLYYGLAEDAQKDGAELIEPTEEEVTYSDGYTESVYAFDIPVPVIGEEFDVALIGTHGNWYDHKVMVSDPVAIEAEE